ncbi:MAG: trehalose-phosphatase [Geodermatophilaceae bacterium]
MSDRAGGPREGADLESLLRTLAAVGRLLVVCDFDGVLAPLVDDPGESAALPDSVTALVGLAALPDTGVALVSGRSLADLARLSGLGAPITLVGSHGREWSTEETDDLDPAAVELLAEVTAALADIAGRYDGVSVETKPTAAVLHVRRARSRDGAAAIEAASQGPARRAGLTVTSGKDVLELAVVASDKGTAVELLRDSFGADAVLFAGDDVTDESALVRLRAADLGIKVGPEPTAATGRVADPQAVAGLLTALLRLRAAALP